MNNRLSLNSPIFKVFLIFLVWRLILVAIAFFAVYFIPLGAKDRFLGGGLINYAIFPEFFAWANFDGEHYLSIAIFGYKSLEQAFFPIYPILISFFPKPNSLSLITSLVYGTMAGIYISNISLVFSLIFLWELIRIDFSRKVAYLTIILLLIFPTSFYFGAVYNESLFLFLLVASFYSARRGNWFLAGVFGALASATRVFGILLLPALLFEAWQQKVSITKMFWIFLVPIGLAAYMWYLYTTVGDPIAFYSFQTLVGEQHQRGIIILPQVYFRYAKMLLTVGFNNPIFQTIVLEFLVGLAFFILPIYGYFKKIRSSYLIFAMLAFLMPTIQGSFSSLPRYVLITFPSFLAAALWINKLPRLIQVIFMLLTFLALIAETTLFLRGYWIA